jgi:PAS domain S-box-containing protein
LIALYFRQSLKIRVTLFTLIIFLVSIWSLAFYATRTLRRNLQETVSDLQFSTATFAAKQITEEVEIRLQSLESTAASVNQDLLDDPSDLQAFLESHETFQRLFNGGIFITGNDGIIRADVPLSTQRIGLNDSDRDYLQAALKEGKTAIGKPVIGRKLNSPVFAVATPIRDADRKVIGALAGVIDLSKPNFLDKITQNTYAKTGGYVLIAPQHKLVVTGTDKDLIMQPLPPPATNPLLDRYIQGFEGSGVVVDSHGIEVLSSGKQIPIAGWLLVVRIPTAEAFSPIHITQRHLILSAILVTLLAGSLTWWNLTRQMAPIVNAATILDNNPGNTRPFPPLPISHPDEIGRLIGGFNHLLETLSGHEEEIRRSRDQLEIRVQERTAELAKTVNKLEQQAQLLELADDAILVCDPKGIIRYWNRGAQKTYGWPPEEAIGKITHELLQTQFPVSLEDTVARALQTGQWEGELRHITQSGTPIVVTSRWGVHKNHNGDLLGFLEINRDVTERVKMREERDRLIDELQEALANVKILSGLIPICASCKKIRDDNGYWNQIESYIGSHSEMKFTHGLCPGCATRLYPDLKLDFGPMLEKK